MAFKMKGMRFQDKDSTVVKDSTMVKEAKREDLKMEEIKKQRGWEYKMINGEVVKVKVKATKAVNNDNRFGKDE